MCNLTGKTERQKVKEVKEYLTTLREQALPERTDAEVPEEIVEFILDFIDKFDSNKDGHSSLFAECLKIQYKKISTKAHRKLIEKSQSGAPDIPFNYSQLSMDFAPFEYWDGLNHHTVEDWKKTSSPILHEFKNNIKVHYGRETVRIEESKLTVERRKNALSKTQNVIQLTKSALPEKYLKKETFSPNWWIRTFKPRYTQALSALFSLLQDFYSVEENETKLLYSAIEQLKRRERRLSKMKEVLAKISEAHNK